MARLESRAARIGASFASPDCSSTARNSHTKASCYHVQHNENVQHLNTSASALVMGRERCMSVADKALAAEPRNEPQASAIGKPTESNPIVRR